TGSSGVMKVGPVGSYPPSTSPTALPVAASQTDPPLSPSVVIEVVSTTYCEFDPGKAKNGSVATPQWCPLYAPEVHSVVPIAKGSTPFTGTGALLLAR